METKVAKKSVEPKVAKKSVEPKNDESKVYICQEKI